MKIRINGQEHHFDNTLSITQLLQELQLDVEKIAVERNLEIVPCSRFADVMLAENDALEIVHFIGGG